MFGWIKACAAVFIASAVVGCGGQVANDASDGGNAGTSGQGETPGTGTPLDSTLTCQQVCDHIIGQCPGVFERSGCVASCSAYNRPSEACKAAHQTFLACMRTVRVICQGTNIITEGCDLEKSARDACSGTP